MSWAWKRLGKVILRPTSCSHQTRLLAIGTGLGFERLVASAWPQILAGC